MKAGALDYVVKSESTMKDMPHNRTRRVREWENIEKRKTRRRGKPPESHTAA
jgi:hypothetical protein